VKKSHARMASAWERRNCDQAGPVSRWAGSMPLLLRISRTVDAATFTPRPASSPWIRRYPHPGFSRASRRIRVRMFRRVAGRPVLPRMDLAAQRRRTMSRCQRRIVSGVTSSRSPWRRAFGITLSKAASSARSAQFKCGRAAAAVAVRRAGGAGSRSLRSATPPHAGIAAATWSPV
jgi:hypothetical protein